MLTSKFNPRLIAAARVIIHYVWIVCWIMFTKRPKAMCKIISRRRANSRISFPSTKD